MKMISLVFKNRRMTQQPKYQYFTYEQNNGINMPSNVFKRF